MPRLPAFAVLACLTVTPIFAAGSENETPPTPTETTTVCEDGQIFDQDKQECVASDQQSLNDDQRYDAVRELAYAGEFPRALAVIASADQTDPRFLNYRGFIARQQGDMPAAMGYYQAALAADPDYILARAYMGLGLFQSGDKAGAKAQLAEIETRGGTGTWAHKTLKKAILYNTVSDY